MYRRKPVNFENINISRILSLFNKNIVTKSVKTKSKSLVPSVCETKTDNVLVKDEKHTDENLKVLGINDNIEWL